MAFAQLTWRESLCDIEVCLSSNQAKLFHLGLKDVPARSTLADEPNLQTQATFRLGQFPHQLLKRPGR